MCGAVSLPDQTRRSFSSKLLATEKIHNIKHAPNDIILLEDPENMSCEGPETNHKKWVKAQGRKTNQGETSNKTMMNHSLLKKVLCYAKLFKVMRTYELSLHRYTYIAYITYNKHPVCFSGF